MSKMTVIQLLNKIAKGEEVPKYIKYYDRLHQKEDTMMCCYNNIIYKLNNNIIDLFDEVKILDDEEEKELPEKINNWISAVGRVDDSNIEEYVHKLFEQQTQLYCKINQLIDCIEKQRKVE